MKSDARATLPAFIDINSALIRTQGFDPYPGFSYSRALLRFPRRGRVLRGVFRSEGL